MKASVKRLVARNEELKGTANYNEQYMEMYYKEKGSNSWKFVGWSVPRAEGYAYDVVGTFRNICLQIEHPESFDRYVLSARNMPYLDFSDN